MTASGRVGLAEVGQGGVDGVAEVDAGVDEGAVEIEDEEAGGREGTLLRVIDWSWCKLAGNEGDLCDERWMREWTRRQVCWRDADRRWRVLQEAAVSALAQTGMTGEAAMQELMAGNERFIAGKITSFPEDLKILKEKTVVKQEPFAAVLSCADSRVPVEILFRSEYRALFVTEWQEMW